MDNADKLRWIRDYRIRTGAGLREAMTAWDSTPIGSVAYLRHVAANLRAEADNIEATCKRMEEQARAMKEEGQGQ